MIVREFTPEPSYPRCILGPPSPTPVRSTHRPHLTDILRDMATTAGIGKETGEFSQRDLEWFAAGGWLFERVFDMAHQEAIDRGDMWSPGELELDGIVGTPDRIDWTRPAVIELKCRWKSSRKFDALEKEFCIELMQVKGYCWMLKILEADLIVFFVAGRWSSSIVPEVRAANLRFTEQELAENWRSVLLHAKRMGVLK